MTNHELRELRKKLGLSQAQLARSLGYSRYQTVSEWENLEREIPKTVAVTVRTMAAAKGILAA